MRGASWCSQLPCRPASGFLAFGISSWRSGPQLIGESPPTSSPRSPVRGWRGTVGGALHALPTAVVVVVQPFHHVSVWLLRCDLGPLVGFLVASVSLVRWASPYFDDDSRPGLAQHIDVLSHLECVMLSFPKSRGKYGTQEFGSSVAWYCRIRRQLELSILHPDYINSPRILFSYLWFGSRLSRRRSRRSIWVCCLISLLMPAPGSRCLDLGKSVVTSLRMSRSWKGCRLRALVA